MGWTVVVHRVMHRVVVMNEDEDVVMDVDVDVDVAIKKGTSWRSAGDMRSSHEGPGCELILDRRRAWGGYGHGLP